MTEPADPVVVDARGLHCPLPIIRLAQASSTCPTGAILTLWSTDPAAAHDVPAWARMRGHTVTASVEVTSDGGYRAITVQLC